MDSAMADMQADDMKHGLYDEPMDTGLREWLEDRIAARLLESADMDDLEAVYYDTQHEWAETLPEADLVQVARDLGIDIEEK
jgi:hypothetical protein